MIKQNLNLVFEKQLNLFWLESLTMNELLTSSSLKPFDISVLHLR